MNYQRVTLERLVRLGILEVDAVRTGELTLTAAGDALMLSLTRTPEAREALQHRLSSQREDCRRRKLVVRDLVLMGVCETEEDAREHVRRVGLNAAWSAYEKTVGG